LTDQNEQLGYISPSWIHIETLLKEHELRRRSASKTLSDTACYVRPDGTIDCKNDLIEGMQSGVQKLTADRVQSTADPESKMIGIIESVDKSLSYSNESIKRRRESANQIIQELDDLIECVEQLTGKEHDIISNLYYSYEEVNIDGVVSRKPVKYMTAVVMSGYASHSHFEKMRKRAIGMLVRLMREKKSTGKGKVG